ncbi:hypothetical protein BD408DRAFT_419471 [Parasitella parasitica]|nr:hypothetical protein BD408DRAFT_419471 [Parasitella parasitica]
MKMTGWQTRLAFPVIPKEQWEFPTMPPEPRNDDPPAKRVRLDDQQSSAIIEKQVVVRIEKPSPEPSPKPSPKPSQKPDKPKRKGADTGRRKSNAPNKDKALAIKASTPRPIAAAAAPSSATNQDQDDELVYIKSEETEQTMPIILPDPNDQNYYCCACNLQKASRASYRSHLKNFHKMPLTPLQPPLFTEASPRLPNLYDANFYCRVCERKFKDSVAYRRHCGKYHGMLIGRTPTVPDPNIIPDPDDPLNYCQACNRSYEVRSIFRDHLRRVHKMALAPVCNPANLDRSSGFVCRFCLETFKEGKVYGVHLQAKHQGKLEKR